MARSRGHGARPQSEHGPGLQVGGDLQEDVLLSQGWGV